MSSVFHNPPAVGTMLNRPEIVALIDLHGRAVVTWAIRAVIDESRSSAAAVDESSVIHQATALVAQIVTPSLRPVINATGVVLHTNLGRAVLGPRVLAEIAPIVTGYSNIEFDLEQGRRGHRVSHIAPLLRFLTGAEDVLVVNNNAAAIILILHTLARRREVVISRGELIEIGGAFRIPDIMAAAGAKMVEVGTTNRTRLSDYESARSAKTALFFKAHTSNYAIKGFTEEVTVAELAGFAHNQGIPFVYDIGSGLLRKPSQLTLGAEPDVQSAVRAGADLVCFSCDKLLGGPQAGIIAGRRDLIARLAKAPLMRALRVGKLTMAALSAACRSYLSDTRLQEGNPAFAMLEQTPDRIDAKAQALQIALTQAGIESRVVDSEAQCGGGTLPELMIASKAVMVVPRATKNANKVAEKLWQRLQQGDRAVLGVLREGRLLFDVYTISTEDIPALVAALRESGEGRS
jgi:L-seryl-tRNA(Ser) seleniumtransferase